MALVCPGLNWTCLWDLPLKSSSFWALPSAVPMPERHKRLRETDEASREGRQMRKRQRKQPWKRWQEGETASLLIFAPLPLVPPKCVASPFLMASRASGRCKAHLPKLKQARCLMDRLARRRPPRRVFPISTTSLSSEPL